MKDAQNSPGRKTKLLPLLNPCFCSYSSYSSLFLSNFLVFRLLSFFSPCQCPSLLKKSQKSNLAQVHPNSWRILVPFRVLCQAKKLEPTAKVFVELHRLTVTPLTRLQYIRVSYVTRCTGALYFILINFFIILLNITCEI